MPPSQTLYRKKNIFKTIYPDFLEECIFGIKLGQIIYLLQHLFGKFPYAGSLEDIFILLPMNISKVELKK